MTNWLEGFGIGPALLPVLAAMLVAGLVRGFAGFGAAMIFMPAASAFIDPRSAVVMLWIADTLPSLQIVVPALREFRWRQVAPAAAGYAVGVPFGAWWLTHADPVALRWFMAALVGVLWIVLASGIRYRGAPHAAYGVGVGTASGFLGGAIQMSGPPILAYWLGGPDSAGRVRANLIVFFAVGTILSGLAFWLAGLFTPQRVAQGLAALPLYAAGIAFGAWKFRAASEKTFRRVALGLILLAAATSLPALDPWLGR
jgi:uncharacterized membrane protein YfcA